MKSLTNLGLSFVALILVVAGVQHQPATSTLVGPSAAALSVPADSLPPKKPLVLQIHTPEIDPLKKTPITNLRLSTKVSANSCPKDSYNEMYNLRKRLAWESCRPLKNSYLIKVTDQESYVVEVERLSPPTLKANTGLHRFELRLSAVRNSDPTALTGISTEIIETELDSLYFYQLGDLASDATAEVLKNHYPTLETSDNLCFDQKTHEYERTMSGSLAPYQEPWKTRAEYLLKNNTRVQMGCKAQNDCQCQIILDKLKTRK